jgi:hypothetical protein
MTDQEFEELVERLRETLWEAERLQKLYRAETGQQYQPPFFLGNYVPVKSKEQHGTQSEGI